MKFDDQAGGGMSAPENYAQGEGTPKRARRRSGTIVLLASFQMV
jgi:hypothetical protein